MFTRQQSSMKECSRRWQEQSQSLVCWYFEYSARWPWTGMFDRTAANEKECEVMNWWGCRISILFDSTSTMDWQSHFSDHRLLTVSLVIVETMSHHKFDKNICRSIPMQTTRGERDERSIYVKKSRSYTSVERKSIGIKRICSWIDEKILLMSTCDHECSQLNEIDDNRWSNYVNEDRRHCWESWNRNSEGEVIDSIWKRVWRDIEFGAFCIDGWIGRHSMCAWCVRTGFDCP